MNKDHNKYDKSVKKCESKCMYIKNNKFMFFKFNNIIYDMCLSKCIRNINYDFKKHIAYLYK